MSREDGLRRILNKTVSRKKREIILFMYNEFPKILEKLDEHYKNYMQCDIYIDDFLIYEKVPFTSITGKMIDLLKEHTYDSTYVINLISKKIDDEHFKFGLIIGDCSMGGMYAHKSYIEFKIDKSITREEWIDKRAKDLGLE